MKDTPWLTVGRITGVHGLTGNLKIWSYAQSVDTFARGLDICLVNEGQTQGQTHVIARASARKKGILLTLQGVATREAAEDLVGNQILMNRKDLPELEEEAWYWHDLMGLAVEDVALGSLGAIDHLFSTGADDILVVKDGDKEVLIPMNQHFVSDVDLEAGTVTTTLPDGFILE
jgi:16S rRNA processing protein RimM